MTFDGFKIVRLTPVFKAVDDKELDNYRPISVLPYFSLYLPCFSTVINNIDNGRKIWEVKRKGKRKNETPHFIINSEGRKIESSEEILKESQKYYENLLQTRPPENLQNKHNVERKKITQLEVKKTILKMKKNKSGDRSRWKAE